MDRRRQLLISALGVLTLGYLGDTGYRRWYEEPLRAAELRQQSLEEELQQTQLETRRQQKRLPQLDELKQRSLPRNPEIAVTEYRSWLLQSIATHGLQQASLDSGNPARVRNLYDRIDFSLRTRGTLSQLTAFLRQFYSTNYLHKIRSLSLTPTSDGTLDVSLTVETLVVPVVADDAHLPQHVPAASELTDEDAYRVISQRNLFRQGESPTDNVKVSAITLDARRQRQVWLSFLNTGETRILAAGDQFSLDGTHLKIQAIEAEYAVIEIDGQARDVAIGHALTAVTAE